jgi:iron complex outermembrane receptor protein
VEGTAADTLDGNRVPGVPEHFLRGALEARLFGAVLRVDQSVASRVFADDRNTIAVDGWNVTDLGLSWETRRGSVRILPNGGLRNVFGNRYSGSVTVNGAFGRVFEPAPGRNGWIGVELRFDRVRASSPDPGL